MKQITPTDSCFRAIMAPDAASVIYKAHFPGSPVTPGACLVEAVCNLMEHHCGRKLRLREIKNVKFLSIIIPDGQSDVVFDITCSAEESSPKYSVKATVCKADSTCAKMSLVFEG
ncbi:MAG: 3-hydroxyacyl-ACP dehydratase [Bacteroidales bacterium]|nr:3-hydroxyacyl-ACP dehydratase [Bacteroidales bacterium]